MLESRVGFPVFKVYIAEPANDKLQLPLVEALEKALRDQLVEALLQRKELRLDTMHESRKKEWLAIKTNS